MKARRKGRPAVRQKRQKHKKSGMTALAVLAALLLTVTAQSMGLISWQGIPNWQTILSAVGQTFTSTTAPIVPTVQEGQAAVHIIDVGQGSSTLIMADDMAMLIDAGDRDDGDAVVQYLQQAGVDKLDYVVASHPHADHIGGLDEVLEAFSVGQLVTPDLPSELIPTSKTYEEFVVAAAANGCVQGTPTLGSSHPLGQGVVQYLGSVPEYDDLNNSSVAVRFSYGDLDFNVMGDLEESSELQLVQSGLSLGAEVLVLGHHGSNTSSHAEFLRVVNGDYFVAQCGYDNEYGHPHKEVLERIQAEEGTLLRSDVSGDVVFLTDGTAMTVQTEKNAA